jgi:hypothetical protein
MCNISGFRHDVFTLVCQPSAEVILIIVVPFYLRVTP